MAESSTNEKSAGHTDKVGADADTDLRSLGLGLEQPLRGPRRAHGASEVLVHRSRDTQ